MFEWGAKDQIVTEHKHKLCVKGVSNAFSLSMMCMSSSVNQGDVAFLSPNEGVRISTALSLQVQLQSFGGRCILTASVLRRTQNETYESAFLSC